MNHQYISTRVFVPAKGAHPAAAYYIVSREGIDPHESYMQAGIQCAQCQSLVSDCKFACDSVWHLALLGILGHDVYENLLHHSMCMYHCQVQ